MAGLARRSFATLTTFVLLAAVGFTLGALAGILWEEPRMILTYLTGGTTEIAWTGEDDAEGEALVVAEGEGESLPDVAAAPETVEPVAISPDRPSRPAKKSAPAAPKPRPEPLKPPPTPAPPVVVERGGPIFAAPPPLKPLVVEGGEPRAAQKSGKKSESRAATSSKSAPPVGPASTRRFAIQVGAFAQSESAERLSKRLEGRGYDAYVTPGAGSKANARWRVRVGPVPDKGTAEELAVKLKKNEKLPTWILEEGGR